jgi:hypothetical protein
MPVLPPFLGDVPLLDRRIRKPLRWLGQAGAALVLIFWGALICAETAKAGLESSEIGCGINSGTEPKTIFANVRLTHGAVSSAPMDIKSVLTTDYVIVSRHGLINDCFHRTISAREDRGVTIMGRDSRTYINNRFGLSSLSLPSGLPSFYEGAGKGPFWIFSEWAGSLLLGGGFRRHGESNSLSGRIEDAEGRRFTRVFEDDKNFYWLTFLKRPIEISYNWCQPCSIAGNQRIAGNVAPMFSFFKTEIDEKQPNSGRDYTSSSNNIKPTGYPELPTPYAPLGGSVLFFGGAWLTSWGFVTKILGWAHVLGWMSMVCGGIILFLWGLPHIAGALAP